MSLEVNAVSYAYTAGIPVLNGVTLRFAPGITLLKGYSGCGKSTLLKLLAGPDFLSPQQGDIRYAGQPMSRTLSRSTVGFVFQQLNLLPLATLERNIAMAGLLAGLPGQEVTARTTQLLDQVGLAEYARRTPETLSGGQQQRAAIARALVKSPRVLLLDEPTSGLDDMNTGLITEILKKLPPDTRCIISTHDTRLVPAANRIIQFPLTASVP